MADEMHGPACNHTRVVYVRMVINPPGEPVRYWDRWKCPDCSTDFAPVPLTEYRERAKCVAELRALAQHKREESNRKYADERTGLGRDLCTEADALSDAAFLLESPKGPKP